MHYKNIPVIRTLESLEMILDNTNSYCILTTAWTNERSFKDDTWTLFNPNEIPGIKKYYLDKYHLYVQDA